jgi:hypothetical protein
MPPTFGLGTTVPFRSNFSPAFCVHNDKQHMAGVLMGSQAGDQIVVGPIDNTGSFETLPDKPGFKSKYGVGVGSIDGRVFLAFVPWTTDKTWFTGPSGTSCYKRGALRS